MIQSFISSIGLVAIGRNEGDRLKKCLMAVVAQVDKVVYVDSGSTDGSVDMARSLGVAVVELDMTRPFTAARARNEGFSLLRESTKNLLYVQFVDGDCEIVSGWVEKAAQFLHERDEVAVVCGRLRERFPDQSVYNMLCDWEWDAIPGETNECGGNAMIRSIDFERIGGYRDDLIAGEEPELCVRLRATGRKIWRLDEEMALHDAAIIHFGQWWNRTRRTGYAFAQGSYLHGAPPERYGVRQLWSAWIWGLGVPLLTACLTVLFGAWGLTILLIYPLQVFRITLNCRRSAIENYKRAFFLVLGKFPEAIGHINFLYNKLTGKIPHLIEYK